jgi:hypothetical protein
MYDIKSIDALIDALGGDTALASELGVSQPAVANWKARGEIPGGWHMRLMAKLVARGLTVDTLAVFGLPDAEAMIINRVLAGNAQSVAA